MLSIGNYASLIHLILVEFVKYFAVLLLSVLAFRVFRGSNQMTRAGRGKGWLLAAFIAMLAMVVGWFSIRNSMGSLYFYYGDRAFYAGRLEPAQKLYATSQKFWNSADATGRQGICVLLLGDESRGTAMLKKAAMMRGGNNTSFEEYHEGLYYLINHQETKAVPFFAEASSDPAYYWTILKYFAAMDLDAGSVEHAAKLMKPYIQAEVTEADQAYIIASLEVADGKSDKARALLKRFSPDDLTPFWKSRFKNLQTRLATN